jgi:hypothetical protein
MTRRDLTEQVLRERARKNKSRLSQPARAREGGACIPLRAAPALHSDSMGFRHHDADMRTPVTLDKDVEHLLREAMHRSWTGLKETLNTAIRAALGRNQARATRRRFVLKARPLGLRPGTDPTHPE